jgi:DUF4097 and DUF4098 domain-containing protein YvlB
MNKNFIRFMIALWSGIAIIMLFILVKGLSNQPVQKGFAFSIGGFERSLNTENLEAETFVFDPKAIEAIEVDLSSQNIKFLSHDQDEIKVIYYTTPKLREERRIGIEQVNKTLSIYRAYLPQVSETTINFFSFTITPQTIIEVYLPTAYAADLNVNMSSGSIVFNKSNFNEMQIRQSSGSLKIEGLVSENVNLTKSSGSTSIKEVQTGDLFVRASSGSLRLEDVKADEVQVRTSSGSTYIQGLIADEITVEASSGTLTVENVIATKTVFKTNSGSKRMKNIESTDVEITSTSGSLNFQGKVQKLVTRSSSGSNRITLSQMPKQVNIQASSGSVTLSIPENSGFLLEHSKNSGSFSSEFKLQEEINTRNRVKGTYGDGSSAINVQTSSGSFNLKKE